MEYKFSKPFEFEGKTYEKLDIDLDNLTGEDLEVIEKQMQDEKIFAPVPAIHRGYCARVGAVAAKVPPVFFKKLPAKAYTQITQEISNFLLSDAD
ncbi:MAG: phage tail assembly protein [Lentisphaeria bacterium]|nr:phage tail assembly protein [Lentisphaeria bacterium]